MTAAAIIQARMGSTRLPGKVLADLDGRPILGRVVDRARRARTITFVGIATTVDPSDDAIVAWCASEGIPCHRGSVNNVLHRYVEAAQRWTASVVVRITGDCPFLCPAAVDALVTALIAKDADYAGYDGPRIGEGIDPFSLRALARFDSLQLPPDEREHLALLVRRHGDWIQKTWISPEPGLTPLPGLRLSVDAPADLAFAREVQQELSSDYSSADLVALFDRRPELIDINRHVERIVPHGVL